MIFPLLIGMILWDGYRRTPIPSSTGGLIHPGNVVRAFKNETKKADLPRIRVHDLRHTSVSLLAAAGVHPKVIQERVGHSLFSATMAVYFHLFPSMQDEAGEKLNRILRPGSPTSSP